jgi:acyl phosphate:glycerol-3-phosphate acyltransferase
VLITLAIFAFLLGSIPFGVIVCRAKGVDIFSIGSGNIGATNVVRAVGPALGGLVLLLDVAKGYVPGLLATKMLHDQPLGIDGQTWSFILGSIAIVGHMFSPWISFRGGKGIATGLGAMLSSIPITGLLALGVMVPVTAVSRFVSLGSIIAALSTIPISIFVSKDSSQVMPILILFNIIVIYKHRSNIARILNGTESKFRFKKNDDEPTQVVEEECKNGREESKNEERNDLENRL